MSTLKEVNETRITLRSYEAVVENVTNGISMNRRTVIPSELALAMLGILEDEAVVSHLLREKNFDEVFESFFNAQNYNGEPMVDEMNSILEMALRYLDESQSDTDVVNSFFLTLVSRFDPNDFSEKETVEALKRFLSRIREFDDQATIQEMFYYLIETRKLND